jgi:glycosyltransferase involved in cell wall biosynthesis
MNKSPLVSIAMATFNGEKYLAQQLNSLLAQDYPNFEIVVSDDGSTDSTWQMLAQYAAQDQRIRLLPCNKNLGVIQNFSRCFANCRGDLISPCDQDDIWYPNKTSRLIEAMGDALLVYCNSRFIDSEGQPAGRTLADTLCMIHGDDPRPFLFSDSVYGHAMVFRKHILDGAGGITAGVPHDWWLAFVAANLGHITYLNEVLVDYRRHQASVTQATVNNRSKQQRQKHLNEDALRLKAMSEFPGPNQAYAKRIRNTWLRWHQSYLDLSMFTTVLREGPITHQAFLKEKTTLQLATKYLAGHQLKRFLRPNYYPE